ncbi:hypothetical protein POM88_001451 [Heracleum sosnowskyi]|uniref:Uncharacterized protein n=1 Tax=Heracleum sosnowskyi TaxID=360622 RepID=A0AAD8JFV5_9APIA|nr:hypothetical protein POM88_001451 [Heracleum sosnowskyi]
MESQLICDSAPNSDSEKTPKLIHERTPVKDSSSMLRQVVEDTPDSEIIRREKTKKRSSKEKSSNSIAKRLKFDDPKLDDLKFDDPSVLAVGAAILGCFAYSKDLIMILEAPVRSEGVRFLQLAPGEFFFTTLKKLERFTLDFSSDIDMGSADGDKDKELLHHRCDSLLYIEIDYITLHQHYITSK